MEKQVTSVAYKDFDTASAPRARIYYSSDSGVLDPEGDAELVAMHFAADPETLRVDLDRYGQLVSRPYYTFLLPTGTSLREAAANSGTGTVQLPYRRPIRQLDQDRQVAVPFDIDNAQQRAPSVLFAEPLLVPLEQCSIVDFEQTSVRSATGVASVQIFAEND